MKTPVFLFCLIILSSALHSQSIPPGSDLDSAPILNCLLDGYTSATGPEFNPVAPPLFCAGADNNVQWVAFLGVSEELVLLIEPSNCMGTSNGAGIQGQIFKVFTNDLCEGESFVNVTDCFYGGGAPNAFFLSSTVIEPGSLYVLIIDGWNGDQCDWEVTLTQGSLDFFDYKEPVESFSIVGESQADYSSIQKYQLPYLPQIAELPACYLENWTLGCASGLPCLPTEVTWEVSGGEILSQDDSQITIKWLETDSSSICATLVCTDTTFEICKTIDVHPPIYLPDDGGSETINEGPIPGNLLSSEALARSAVETEAVSFQLYPNPADEWLRVQAQGAYGGGQLHLYNTAGTAVLSHRLAEPNSSISLQDLPKGLYFYTITASDNRILQRGKLLLLDR